MQGDLHFSMSIQKNPETHPGGEPSAQPDRALQTQDKVRLLVWDFAPSHLLGKMPEVQVCKAGAKSCGGLRLSCNNSSLYSSSLPTPDLHSPELATTTRASAFIRGDPGERLAGQESRRPRQGRQRQGSQGSGRPTAPQFPPACGLRDLLPGAAHTHHQQHRGCLHLPVLRSSAPASGTGPAWPLTSPATPPPAPVPTVGWCSQRADAGISRCWPSAARRPRGRVGSDRNILLTKTTMKDKDVEPGRSLSLSPLCLPSFSASPAPSHSLPPALSYFTLWPQVSSVPTFLKASSTGPLPPVQTANLLQWLSCAGSDRTPTLQGEGGSH